MGPFIPRLPLPFRAAPATAAVFLVFLAFLPRGPEAKAPSDPAPGSAALPRSLGGSERLEALAEKALAKAMREEGWQNGGDYPPLGDPRAQRVVKDRPLRSVWRSFPPTLRAQGPNSRLTTISTLHNLQYESLIQIHSNTEAFIPMLAKEWKIETDLENSQQTFWFRIDERAHFSDGSPVTAEDIKANWWHRVKEDRNDPSNHMTFFEGYHEPVVVDEYTVKVTTKKLNWRLFLYFGGMLIYPKRFIDVPGEEFIKGYNWKFMPGSGPYRLAENGIKKGEYITLERRHDWWAEDETWAKWTFNFETLKFVVIREQELEYEKFKAGELDYYIVSRAQRWVQEIPKEEIIQKGWVQRRKIFNKSPQGFGGLCFNMRKWPFSDKRVRLAFAHLFNRERLNEKLFYNQYELIDSYFPGRDWGNPEGNPKIRFDPDKAEELLWAAGFKDRNDDGYLVDEKGRVLEVTLQYAYQSWERIWLVVKEDYEDAGIRFNLKLIDPSTLIKNVWERNFSIVFWSWTGLLFPNPETSWRSSLADKTQNNNLPGFKSQEVDELLKRYNVVLDREEQKKIIRKVDSLIFKEYPYALGWYANYDRILYWRKFGHPESYFSKIGDLPQAQVMAFWWFDPEKEKELEEARRNGASLPQGPEEVRYWDEKTR